MSYRLPVLTAALLGLCLTTAQAGELIAASTTVPYGDLNLARANDVQTLAVRLTGAAKQVCKEANPQLAPEKLQDCIDASVALAVSRIEISMESHVHDSLSGVRTALELH